jgi:hypothetical protein
MNIMIECIKALIEKKDGLNKPDNRDIFLAKKADA